MDYFYDNVRLPDINTVWTAELKAQYPYAVIVFSGFASYSLILKAEPWVGTDEDYVVDDKTGTVGKKMVNASSGVVFHTYFLGPDEPTPPWDTWDREVTEIGQAIDYNGDIYRDGYFCAIWSSHDILGADGQTVLVAVTDPIPVNPAPTLDPTALLMGWQVGNRIRQRK